MTIARPVRAALGLSLFIAAPATAQEAQPAPQPAPVSATAAPLDPARCELHIWGGERLQVMQMGLLGGMGVVGAAIDAAAHVDSNRQRQAELGAALDTPSQAAALASLDLPTVLNLRDYRVVTHDEPMDPRQANRERGRHAASPSRCYAELMVTRVLYQKTPIYGRALRASFLFRDFQADRNAHFVFAGRGGNGLRVFPAREESQVQAANEELVSVFKANFTEYANNLNQRRQGTRTASR